MIFSMVFPDFNILVMGSCSSIFVTGIMTSHSTLYHDHDENRLKSRNSQKKYWAAMESLIADQRRKGGGGE